jgi:hypothetical protein
VKKSCFVIAAILSAGLMACSKAPASGAESQVTVRNNTDAHEVQVYWTATECNGLDVQHNADAVCHYETIGGKKSSTYTFAKGTTNRAVLVYRPKDYCALVGSGDLKDFSVAGDETLRTDGCEWQKDPTQSSALSPGSH